MKIIKKSKNYKNSYFIYDDYAEIILLDKYKREKARAKIDLDDLGKCKDYAWGDMKGYVVANRDVYLHRFVMDCPENKVVDHINHDPYDNRKCQLRICTVRQNQMNRSLFKSNKTGVTGVDFRSDRNKWRAQIKSKDKLIHLGYYDTFEEARKARLKAEKIYFGEHAYKGKH